MSEDKSETWIGGVGNSPYGNVRAPGGKIRLLLVDDNPMFRKGLRSMLELEPDMEVAGEAGSGDEALEQIAASRPDAVLMDLSMPGMDGMLATRRLSDTYPGTPVIILTMSSDREHLREARRAGASAFVLKDAGSEILLSTIRTVVSGEMPLFRHDDLSTDPLDTGPFVGGTLDVGSNAAPRRRDFITNVLLTANERAILRLLAHDMTMQEMQHSLDVPEAMVRTYLAEIYRKLGISGRAEAIDYAREHGLDQASDE